MDTLILPSYREGFGTVVIEAEAMGVPVIVTDIPGPTDAMVMVKHGLIVKKADIESLKEAIETLYNNKNLIEKMSRESYSFASTKFDSEQLKRYILDDRNRLFKMKGY